MCSGRSHHSRIGVAILMAVNQTPWNGVRVRGDNCSNRSERLVVLAMFEVVTCELVMMVV